jgi:hypothetical protein
MSGKCYICGEHTPVLGRDYRCGFYYCKHCSPFWLIADVVISMCMKKVPGIRHPNDGETFNSLND